MLPFATTPLEVEGRWLTLLGHPELVGRAFIKPIRVTGRSFAKSPIVIRLGKLLRACFIG